MIVTSIETCAITGYDALHNIQLWFHNLCQVNKSACQTGLPLFVCFCIHPLIAWSIIR